MRGLVPGRRAPHISTVQRLGDAGADVIELETEYVELNAGSKYYSERRAPSMYDARASPGPPRAPPISAVLRLGGAGTNVVVFRTEYREFVRDLNISIYQSKCRAPPKYSARARPGPPRALRVSTVRRRGDAGVYGVEFETEYIEPCVYSIRG
jgi:hypothetical protein